MLHHPNSFKGAREQLDQFLVEDADHDPLRARGVRQRPQEVEGRSHPERFPHRRHEAHGRVVLGREQEPQSDVVDALRDVVEIQF